MGFHVDDPRLDRLVAEVARMTGESEADAMIHSLEERRDRLRAERIEDKATRVRKVLEEKIWPLVPPEVLGKEVTKAEREEILGYGPTGV